MLIIPQDWPLDKGPFFFQDAVVPCGSDIKRCDIWQPQQVIRNPRADADAGGRMPPVLHIPLLKLPGGCHQNLIPQQFGLRIHQGHAILQLIPEAIGTAALVKRGPRVHSA